MNQQYSIFSCLLGLAALLAFASHQLGCSAEIHPKPATQLAPVVGVFSEDQSKEVPTANLLTSGLIGCPAADIAISEMARGRRGEYSWVAVCADRAMTCSYMQLDGDVPSRNVYCTDMRQPEKCSPKTSQRL